MLVHQTTTATAGETALQGVRVVFVLPSLGLGGAERQAFFLARHLRHHVGADVQIISLSPRAALADRCDESDIPYAFFELRHGYGRRLDQAVDLLRFTFLLRRLRAQILLPYCMFQNVLCGLTWRASGARVCVWNQRDEGRSRMDRWVEQLAVWQTPRFISNSIHGAEFVTSELRVSPDRVHVVSNGIAVPPEIAPRKNYRTALGLSDDAFLACMVANLHAKKDHTTLIAAWRTVVDRLDAEGRSAHLLLAGALHDRFETLQNQVRALSLHHRVHFLGQVQETDDLLRNVDLAVFSSYTEGMPNAVLEAMAQGLVVVATDYPGICEAVGTDGRALLASPRNPSDLADKIVTAARDTALRRRLGGYGKRRINELFSIDRMAATMTAIIAAEWRRRL